MPLSKMNLGVGKRSPFTSMGIESSTSYRVGHGLAPVLEARTAIMLGLTDWPAAYPRNTGSPGSVREHFSEEQRW